MATYYIDFENGNDANDGTTFANRWKTITNGATAARIAAGDEIRVMASPDPTSIGSATWTGGGRQLSVTIASSTNATPIVITTSAAHGLVANDYVAIANHTVNTNAVGVWKVGTVSSSTEFQILNIDGTNTTGNGVGAATGNATKYNNLIVKLSSPVTKNIALFGGQNEKPVWTASTSVTATRSSPGKEGNTAAQIAIAAGFTTGKAAYYTLPSTLDLSSYQQVSFWINQSAGTLGAAGATYIALCSDTTGDTVVHTCNIPNIGSTNVWMPVTVDLGTNLSSSIQSVAFYVVTDNGAQTFIIDNIIACKASSSNDSLSLTSLISKSSGSGEEAWYPIQSINYDAIQIGGPNALTSLVSSLRGYNGASETVTTYKRETIKTTPVAIAATAVSVINASGTSGNVITYSGGWNRTDMSTQTGRTWLDGQNNNGAGLTDNSAVKNFYKIDKIDLCRYSAPMSFGISATYATNVEIGSIYIISSANNAALRVNNLVIGSYWANNNSNSLFIFGSTSNPPNNIQISNMYVSNEPSAITISGLTNVKFGTIKTGNNSNRGIGFSSIANVTIDYLESTNSADNTTTSAGLYCSGSSNIRINGGFTSGNRLGGVIADSGGVLYLNNFTINETAEVPSSAGAIYSNRHDNTDNNNWIWQYGGTINQQSSVVDSPASRSWKMSPTNSFATDGAPLALKIASVVCGASSLVTVTARMRRDNTGLTMRLVCPGGQILGVASDVSSSMTAAADTWETVTITFTPTKAGGVDIYAHAFGGTTYNGYVCNVTASQA